MVNKVGVVEVTQVNLNKCYLAQVGLVNSLTKKAKFMAGVQEPYCYKSKPITLGKNITLISSQESPRAMIIGSSNLGLQAITHSCSKDTAVALMRLEGRHVMVVSFYMDILLPVISN